MKGRLTALLLIPRSPDSPLSDSTGDWSSTSTGFASSESAMRCDSLIECSVTDHFPSCHSAPPLYASNCSVDAKTTPRICDQLDPSYKVAKLRQLPIGPGPNGQLVQLLNKARGFEKSKGKLT